jgi:hypothetical protein
MGFGAMDIIGKYLAHGRASTHPTALEEKQKKERESLELLVNNINSRVSDIDSLAKVLSSYASWGHPDPIPHIKLAMQNYLERNIKQG